MHTCSFKYFPMKIWVFNQVSNRQYSTLECSYQIHLVIIDNCLDYLEMIYSIFLLILSVW